MRFAETVKIVLPFERELNYEGQRDPKRDEKGDHNLETP